MSDTLKREDFETEENYLEAQTFVDLIVMEMRQAILQRTASYPSIPVTENGAKILQADVLPRYQELFPGGNLSISLGDITREKLAQRITPLRLDMSYRTSSGLNINATVTMEI